MLPCQPMKFTRSYCRYAYQLAIRQTDRQTDRQTERVVAMRKAQLVLNCLMKTTRQRQSCTAGVSSYNKRRVLSCCCCWMCISLFFHSLRVSQLTAYKHASTLDVHHHHHYHYGRLRHLGTSYSQ